jgi:predicted nucleotidyltransferase component of viral defense system
MLHEDKVEFLKTLERTAAQTGLPQHLLEKDYYLTLVLSRSTALSEDLIFKGGTCLNKCHYSYYRLSEDLDFTMRMPRGNITRQKRKATIQPVKTKLPSTINDLGMSVDTGNAGHRESSQYIYYLHYPSVLFKDSQSIKLEIGLRYNPLLPPEIKNIQHRFLHPFTQEPLFEGGNLPCLQLKELVAEKLRAAATRPMIAPRDFYDLGHILKTGFDFKDKDLWELFRAKLNEDGFDTDLKKYRKDLGRTSNEIVNMESRIESELLDVLSLKERNAFKLGDILLSLNKTLSVFE